MNIRLVAAAIHSQFYNEILAIQRNTSNTTTIYSLLSDPVIVCFPADARARKVIF